MKICSVEGCNTKAYAYGWCNKHYFRWRRHGDPNYLQRGMGYVTNKGYRGVEVRGKNVLIHVVIAEAALGKPLPPGALVHHADGDKLNNTRENLVICPDEAYHHLLHQRLAAWKACGNPDWRKCNHCKQYDDPSNLRIINSRNAHHRKCVNAYNKAYRQRTIP